MPYQRSGGKQCVVLGCTNSQKKLHDWKFSKCLEHGIEHQDCSCMAPYKLHCIPANKENRLLWLKSINRKDFNPSSKSLLFVYASGAQDVLTRGASSSPMGRSLTAGVGLMLAVYCGFSASGACVNPCIALMFCLTGKLQWKRYPLYVVCEFIGAFLAACYTYGIYSESISNFDGGERQMYGINATAQIFTSFPKDDLSRTTGFFDIFTGSGLLVGTTCMLIDPHNAKTASGVIPIGLVFMLYGILMCFGVQTGAPINLSIDFSGRLFTYFAGYGSEVFSRGNYWFWVPPVACVCGALTFVTTYQLMIGNHLLIEEYSEENTKDSHSMEKTNGYANDNKKDPFTSQDSMATDVTNVTDNTRI